MKLKKMRKEFINGLLEYSKVNEAPYLLTGDLGYSVLEPYQELYPEKFINVGIMEQSMMSIAAGLASQGNKVFAYSISNFATFRALEQLRLDIAFHKLDVCVVGIGTGFQYGTAGYSHWAVEDLAAVSSLEKFRIFSPSDESSTSKSVVSFLQTGGPTYLRLGKSSLNLNDKFESIYIVPNVRIFGSGTQLIFSHGSLVQEIIQNKSFNPSVFSLVVFDEIESMLNEKFNSLIKKSKGIKVIEDVVFSGSLGSRVCRFLAENNLKVPFKWIGIEGSTLESAGGSEDYLRKREFGFNYLDSLFLD
jgi:transketolase